MESLAERTHPMPRIRLLAFALLLASLASCDANPIYDRSEIHLISIGVGDTSTKVRFDPPDDGCPGLEVTSLGDTVMMRFLRGDAGRDRIACRAQLDDDGKLYAMVPFDLAKRRVFCLYVADDEGRDFVGRTEL